MSGSRLTLLLDFDGVINDPSAMLRWYGKITAKLLARKFGGEPEEWQAAHDIVMKAMVTWSPDMAAETERAYNLFYREENRRWIVAMFRYLKREPPEEMTAQQLADRLRFLVPSLIKTPLPGALAAIDELHRQGHTLILSSAGCSAHCRGALTGLGILDRFKAIYGADLVDCFKDSPRYYDRLMDAEDLDPGHCVVVDDRSRVLGWARQLGCKSVQVRAEGKPRDDRADLVVEKLSYLPPVLPQLAGKAVQA